MSKLACGCGHTIYDQTDHLPYKARFSADEDARYLDDDLDNLVAFVQARERGEEEQFIEHLCGPLGEVSGAASWYDLRWGLFFTMDRNRDRVKRDMYECEGCGRLWLQVPDSNRFLSYVPEGEARGILRSYNALAEASRTAAPRLSGDSPDTP
jgi:hypothetical protein